MFVLLKDKDTVVSVFLLVKDKDTVVSVFVLLKDKNTVVAVFAIQFLGSFCLFQAYRLVFFSYFSYQDETCYVGLSYGNVKTHEFFFSNFGTHAS